VKKNIENFKLGKQIYKITINKKKNKNKKTENNLERKEFRKYNRKINLLILYHKKRKRN